MIVIDEEACTGCGLCIKSCPEGAIELEEGVAKLEEGKCISCAGCIPACPVDAVEMKVTAQKVEDISEYRDVWVFMEQEKMYEKGKTGKLKPVGPELLGAARDLASRLKEKVSAVLLGFNIKGYEDCASYGAEKIYSIDDEGLDVYSVEAYTSTLSMLISEYKPNIFLFGATHVGRELAPSVAANLGLGLTADCTGLSIEEIEGRKLLLQTRPAFGGNVMADIICPNTRPQMATVRPGVFEPPKPEEGREYELVEEEMGMKLKVPSEILEIVGGAKGEERLEEADYIVSGGRGVGSTESFKILEELAKELGGTVGCSRPIVEKGWMPKARQVGQSGKTVSPKLYIACGISGAVQHQVGIRDSNVIIAINKDSKASIFDIADLCVVGDLHEVIPLLTEEIRKFKKGSIGT